MDIKKWKYHSLGNKFPFPIGFLVKQKSERIEVQQEFLRLDYFRCNLMIDYYLGKDRNYNYEISIHTERANKMLEDKPEWLI